MGPHMGTKRRRRRETEDPPHLQESQLAKQGPFPLPFPRRYTFFVPNESPNRGEGSISLHSILLSLCFFSRRSAAVSLDVASFLHFQCHV